MSELNLRSNYNPDVLSCLANLSNDEVFTPPAIANQMLDMLPQELFESPDTKFLDPACKSGIFLREIAKRLIEGLKNVIPDLQERLDHIYHEQLYGIAITELTSLMARRSLYCSKYPNSTFSISSFDDIQGNIRYRKMQHHWINGSCSYCGANQEQLDRGEEYESHAYEFIHIDNLEEILNMKFDVVISNPPYQLDTAGAGRQAKPIYQNFVRQAQKLNPHYIVMITPSRWLTGGMGLDQYRSEMLNDNRIVKMVDYSLSRECFPGVDIAGGVSYFLWQNNYHGTCNYTYIDGDSKTVQDRTLNEFDVFVRNNLALGIVKKVMMKHEECISKYMSSLGPFGLGTSERGSQIKTLNSYVLLSSAGRSFIDKKKITSGENYIDKWKVIIGKATSAGAATASKDGDRKVIATLDVLEPNAVCTFSYFIGGAFKSKSMADNFKRYISTKFVRFLLLQCLSSIDISKNKFRFVPDQDFSKTLKDQDLYKKYNLTKRN